jgi:hypothetical protein
VTRDSATTTRGAETGGETEAREMDRYATIAEERRRRREAADADGAEWNM